MLLREAMAFGLADILLSCFNLAMSFPEFLACAPPPIIIFIAVWRADSPSPIILLPGNT